MDATELGRWTRFAAKGGIGICTALQDCVAEEPEDLMFMKDDEITVLMQLADDDVYLGYCEGVVGRFLGSFVRFHSPLKKPVMAKRASANRSASTAAFLSRPSSSQSAVTLSAQETGSHTLPNQSLVARTSSPTMSYSYSNSSSILTEASSSSSQPEILPMHPGSSTMPETAHVHASNLSISSILDSGLLFMPIAPAHAPGVDEESPVHIVTNAAEHSSRQKGSSGPSSPTTITSDRFVPPVVGPLIIRKHAQPAQVASSSSFDTQEHMDAHAIIPEHSELQSNPQESFSLDTEDSSRISIAMSDGITGIGLSLLQGFVGGMHDDDDVSSESSQNSMGTAQLSGGSKRNSAQSTTEGNLSGTSQTVARPESEYSVYSFPQSSRRSLSEFPPPVPPYAQVLDRVSRISVHSEFSGSDWEGASDIYDNYRYSRFSVASKVSRMSQGSLRPMGPWSDVPPIPAELPTVGMGADVKGTLLGKHGPNANVSQDPKQHVADTSALTMTVDGSAPLSPTDTLSDKILKAKPSPLELISGRASSPLLHAAFGSPTGPTTPLSMKSFLSPSAHSPSSSPSLPSGASMNSFRVQQEQLTNLSSPIIRPSRESFVRYERLSGQDIVIEDDDDSFVDLPSPVDQSAPSQETNIISTDDPAPPYSLTIPGMTSSPALPTLLVPAQHPTSPSSAVVSPLVNPYSPSAGNSARRSIFLPHPHAPKPAEVPTGPLYGRQPVGPMGQPLRQAGFPPGSAIQTLHMAITFSHNRYVTIYARFEFDLTSSAGPVPISFSLDPPNNIPANKPGVSRSMTASPQLASQSIVNDHRVAPDQLRGQSPRIPDSGRHVDRPDSISQVIPRPNFVSHVPSQRPRSRSFSGFDAKLAEYVAMEDSRQAGGGVAAYSHGEVVTKRSKSTTATSTTAAPPQVQSPQRATVSHSATVVRTIQKPSPLSLSQNIIVAPSSTSISPTSLKSPRSPLARPPMLPVAVASAPSTPLARMTSFEREPSTASHGGPPSVGHSLAHEQEKTTIVSEVSRSTPPLSPRSPPAPLMTPQILRHSRSTITSSSQNVVGDVSRPRVSSQGKLSVDQVPYRTQRLQVDGTSLVDSPESTSSLLPAAASRAGVFSNHRSQSNDRSMQVEDRSPIGSFFSVEHPTDHKTVSVQDMDFELVGPTTPHSPLARQSVESLPFSVSSRGRENTNMSTDNVSAPQLKQPSLDHHRDTVEISVVADKTDMDAHRQRELRWISIMTSVPASQARKNKKVRKLILEGVPASVRYQVWAHLTDSKAKRMEGLYSRLSQRDRGGAIADIERDAQQIFHNQPLQDQSLVNVLRAYMSMVPDTQYGKGLALVAGQLLLQSPEEDAFWIFVSLMDSHLRPYFSLSNMQLEVDAALFYKAVEANDVVLSKKLFVDLAITPISVCRQWFTCVFADSFSSEYILRIWDIFLFEGVPFLFRVGLGIMSCCRHLLLQGSDQETASKMLSRPPAMCLPSTPDAFLDIVFSAKLKDEDVRKQRAKMETQIKRQTQGRPPIRASTIGPLASTPISLPRNYS